MNCNLDKLFGIFINISFTTVTGDTVHQLLLLDFSDSSTRPRIGDICLLITLLDGTIE